MIEDSESHMRVQIEQAAAGCISGSGAEWPHLLHALRHYGERAHKDMMAITLRTAARRVMSAQGWQRGLAAAVATQGGLMPYPQEWAGSTALDDETGTATFTVEGVQYMIDLDSFATFQKVSAMLDAAFKQGKVFAAQAMRSHIEKSLDVAERAHDLN